MQAKTALDAYFIAQQKLITPLRLVSRYNAMYAAFMARYNAMYAAFMARYNAMYAAFMARHEGKIQI
jgi:hypothetical protein